MPTRGRVLITLLTVLSAHGASLDDVLARMDGAAKQFKAYSATAKVINYHKVLGNTSEENGSFRLRRIKSGVGGIMDLTEGPDRKVLHFNGPLLEIYLPKAQEVQVINERQYASAVNRMLLLGFSVSRDEVKRDYGLALGGAEKVGSMVEYSNLRANPTLPDSAFELKLPKGVEKVIEN